MKTRLSIKYKIILSLVGIVILATVVLSYVVLTRQQERLFEQTVERGKIVLNTLLNNATDALIDDDVLSLNILLRQVSSVPGLSYGVIVSRESITKAHTDPENINTEYQPILNPISSRMDGEVEVNEYDLNGVSILQLSQPIKFNDIFLGTAYVGISLKFIEDIAFSEALVLGGIAFIVIMVGIVFGIVVGLSFTRPILELVKATNAIGSGNFEYKISEIRNDELGQLATAVNTMSDELNKKRLMQDSFGKYVGSDILEMIMNDPNSDLLRGTRNQATVLFTDVRGFTKYSENREPEKVVEALNEYFAIATQAILDNSGYVDKFIGDAVLGVFGVPVPCENHTEMAVRAALQMQKDFDLKAKKRSQSLLKSIGIGINTGVVMAGNIGSQVKLEYTVIGDAVNVASRLNSLAGKQETVISESVFKELSASIKVESMGEQQVKGKAEPIKAYKVLSFK